MPLLQISDLEVHYRQPGWRTPPLHAVDGVTMSVDSGKTVGVVGESGSGKSTIGRAVLGLAPVSRGSVSFDGKGTSRAARAASLQAIFQDPYSSLDPLRTIGQTMAEPLQVQRVGKEERLERVRALLVRVGLPASSVERFPHEFSGGQRQRIAIARALVLDPTLVVCDEPISALDLSTQASVLNLLQELQEERQLAYLFVAHDLVAVRHLSHDVVVLYRGRAMEKGTAAEVCDAPLHPYSRALWAAAPVPDPVRQRAQRAARLESVSTTTSASVTPPTQGCPFAPRCPFAAEACWTTRPRSVAVGERTLECHLFDPTSAHPQAGAGAEVVLAGSVPA